MEISNNFLIVETLCYEKRAGEKGHFRLLQEHIERLEKSAAFWGFPFNRDSFSKTLEQVRKIFIKKGKKLMRVRLALDRTGSFKLTYSSIAATVELPVRIDVSEHRVNSTDIFLYHKTTNRHLFELERRRLDTLGLFETIFLNERAELTEGTITTLFINTGDGVLLTPALSCGLLPGTLRRHLLEQGRAREAVLRLDDLFMAKEIFVGNSVRGLLKARIIAGSP